MKAIILFLLLFAFSATYPVQNANAANTTIGFEPANGQFDKEFTVSLVINGHGEKFNAAEAQVKASPKVIIRDLIFGDCNLSFLATPTRENPSFSGIIMGTYSTGCTVYKLRLASSQKGKGEIDISNASVRRYGDAVEILSRANNATYTFAKAVSFPSEVIERAGKNGLYTVNVKAVSGNEIIKGAEIILSTPDGKNNKKGVTDDKGEVGFESIKEGIYSVSVVINGDRKVETIVNVSGLNKDIRFSIDLKNQANNPLLKNSDSSLDTGYSSSILIMVSVIAIALAASLFFVLFNKRKKIKFNNR